MRTINRTTSVCVDFNKLIYIWLIVCPHIKPVCVQRIICTSARVEGIPISIFIAAITSLYIRIGFNTKTRRLERHLRFISSSYLLRADN